MNHAHFTVVKYEGAKLPPPKAERIFQMALALALTPNQGNELLRAAGSDRRLTEDEKDKLWAFRRALDLPARESLIHVAIATYKDAPRLGLGPVSAQTIPARNGQDGPTS